MLHRGVVSINELRSEHVTDRQIEELVASRRLIRVARGWYATPMAPPALVRAVQLGGRVGCLSGCQIHGLWVPPFAGTHVMLNPGKARPVAEDVQFHRLSTSWPSALMNLEDCVAQVLHRHDAESGLIVLESAVEKGLLTPSAAKVLIADAPRARQLRLQHFTPGSGSGSETRVRLFLQRRNVPLTPQARIPSVGRVDLLVGNSLIIECDSAAHHTSRQNREEDYRRDLAAWALGYRTLRLSYSQIWHTWHETSEVLIAELATRRHLRHPVPRAA